MKEIYLYQLNKDFKLFLTAFLFALAIGIGFGLFYLYHTTSFDSSVTTERLVTNQKNIEDDFGIDESPTKSTGELLTTTHNHIISFAFIFFFMGGIFYFNSIIEGPWKVFLIVEPLISTIVSFGSMWMVRYLGEGFIYLTIISAILMYISFFIMLTISLYDLNLKQPA